MSDEKAMVQQNEEQNTVIDIQNTGYKLTPSNFFKRLFHIMEFSRCT